MPAPSAPPSFHALTGTIAAMVAVHARRRRSAVVLVLVAGCCWWLWWWCSAGPWEGGVLRKPAANDDDAGLSPLVAYLSQGPAASQRILADRLGTKLPEGSYVFLFHSFDKDCDGCLFRRATSFAEGKNLLVGALARSPDWERVRYVVSFDDDAGLLTRRETTAAWESGWSAFHELLLDETTTHPLIKPLYDDMDTRCRDPSRERVEGSTYQTCDDEDLWGGADTYQSCTDENMWAIRRDHLDFVYPHSTHRKDFFWANAMRVFYLTLRCYPAGFLVHHSFLVTNREHRYKERGFPDDEVNIHEVATEMLREAYPSLGPWRPLEGLSQRCDVQKMPSLGVHPVCKAATEARFRGWLAGTYQP